MSHILAVVRRSARPVVVLVAALSALTASALAYGDGIDISHWQGSVNWTKVKSDDVTFAFMKATEGTYYTDPTLKTNWNGAEKAGIYRAAYHFARPSIGSADAQARYFVAKVGSFRGKGDLPPVLDLEATGGLSAAHLRRWVSNWLKTVESLTGRTPILYFSPYFWIDNLGNSTAFTRYPLWIAHYTTGSPLVPGGWKTWTFWQHTSSGTVSGISGHVDMNNFNGTNKQLAALALSSSGSTAPAPSGPTLPVGAATRLSMAASTTRPAIDQTVTFTGALSTTTPVREVAGRAVSLWDRTVGSSTWSLARSGTTDSSGHYTMTAAVRRSADYQVRWAGGKRYAASASPTARMTTPSRVAVALHLHKDRTSVRKGHAMMFYGHVMAGSRAVTGQVVRFYKRSPGGGAWIYVSKSTSVAPTGWYSIVIHPKITRVWKAVYSGTDRYLPLRSRYVTVRPR